MTRRQQAVGMAKGESSKIGSEWKTSNLVSAQGLCKRKIREETEEESCPKEILLQPERKHRSRKEKVQHYSKR
jgi:hypothetical protein